MILDLDHMFLKNTALYTVVLVKDLLKCLDFYSITPIPASTCNNSPVSY